MFLPNAVSKYENKLVGQDIMPNSKKVFFEDINGDNKSEKIVLINNNFGNASYLLYDNNDAFINQQNLSTKYNRYRDVWFQDENNNGTKEFYLLTKSNDSVFLNIHEHFTQKSIVKSKIFVDKIGVHNGDYDFTTREINNYFYKGNKTKEVVFSLNVGYGMFPRSIYKYNSTTKKISKSQHLTNTIGVKEVVDLDNDGKSEILINSIATSNIIDSIYSNKSDNNSWIIALSNNLEYLFNPIEIKSKGKLKVISLTGESESFLMYLFQSIDKKVSSKIIKINIKGEILNERILPNDKHKHIHKINENTFTVYNPVNGHLNYYNQNLELIKNKHLESNLGMIYLYDINNDDEKEWITSSYFDNNISIHRNDFSSFTSINLSEVYIKDFGVRAINKKEKHLYVHQKKKISYYKYNKNNDHIFKYLIYVATYLLVLFTVFLITKSHQYREKKKSDFEKKILDLQLKSIKNQVDSHFVFNALNTISEMSLSENKFELDSFISGYSKFMRTTLEHTDKISTTIKEELDYTENFIKLQQLKLKNSFDYKIEVDHHLKTVIKIPKHCIFTFVENAIKYGLSKEVKGFISINLKEEKEYLLIQIKDNGSGIQKTIKSEKKGTGNGLKIMNEIFDLYQKRFNTKITHSIDNIIEKDSVSGVLVTIKIKKVLSKKYI